MPRRHRKDRPRRKVAPLVLVTALVSALSPFYLAFPAQAASPPGNYTVVQDPNGADDVPGQGDLTQLGRDDSDSSLYNLFWSWDDTDWPGSNTGDACALFDTNANGNVDYTVCVEVGAGAGSTVVQSAGSPGTWSCDDSKTDRCPGSTSQANGATVGTLASFGASPPADLVTDTDPFNAGGNDSTVQVHIPKSSLPSGAVLTEVCSFPSIANGGINSDPKDCLSNPGAGSLVIEKFARPDDGTPFPFTVNPGNIAVSLKGTATSAPITLPAGSNYSVTEAVPDQWFLDNAFCFNGNQRPVGTETDTGITDVSIDPGGTTTCVITDVAESQDLSVTKTASPSTFTAAGQTINYTVTAKNIGNNTLFFVSMNDPLLGGDLDDCTDGNGNTVNSHVNLAPGDVMQCTGSYQTTASDVTAGKVVNKATVRGSGGEDESTIVRTATATVNLFVPPPPPVGSPVLGVTKTSVPATGSTVQRGDQVAYTLSYGNTGTAAASGVVLTDALPADLDYVTGSASNGGSYDATTRTLTWQLGSLATGATGTVTFTASVAQTATDGEVLHNVGVIAAGGINDPSNSDDVTVTVPVLAGAVTISKSVDKDVAEFGDTLTYRVRVGATGNKDQTHVVAHDTVPDGTSYVDGSAACDLPCSASESDRDLTWNVGTLTPGSSTVVAFKVTVDAPTPDANGGIPAETVSNVATVTFDADPVETSNKVETDIAAVLGEKAVRPPKVEPDKLPFTGMPVPLLQLLTMAAVAIAVGTLLVRRAHSRPAVVTAPLVIWRDQ